MKKYFCLLCIFVMTFASTGIFAQNQCIRNIEQHIHRIHNGRGTPYFDELNLSSCQLQDKDMVDIVAFLQKRNDIVHILLSNNFFTEKGASILAKSHLQFVSIAASHNALGDDGAVLFSQIVAKKDWYQSFLDLSDNQISDAGAQALAANITWSILYLEKNHIGNAGMIALAKNTNIEMLYLNHNDISDAGALEAARIIRTSQLSLYTLELGWNHIGKMGLTALIALKNDNILANLWVEGNT